MSPRRILAAALLLMPVAALAQKAPECGAFPTDSAEVLCLCAPGDHQGAVWGSGPYTSDSDICVAAVHAGVLGPDGGRVIARRVEDVANHPGSLAHGIESSSWGAYPTSFTFAGATTVAAAEAPACRMLGPEETDLTCSCSGAALNAPGSVWGSNPYTADSDICGAALHAGVLGMGGGTVSVTAADGLESYPPSLANGVQSSRWGAYDRSLTFR